MNKKIGMIGLVVIACMISAIDVSASAIILKEDGWDWSTGTAWTGDAVPGSADDAYVRGGRSVDVTTDVGSIDQVFIGDSTTWGTHGTVNITAGKLVTTGASQVGRQLDGANGTLKISGGTYQSGGADGGVAMLIGADTTSASTTGILEISGTGTFIGRAIIGSTQAGDSGDVFRIKGSNATVGNTSTAGSNSLEFRSGTMEWIFDATGASTANFQEVVTFGAGSDGIVVDGSAYTGGVNTFTLLNAGVLSGTAPTINLIGFAEGTTYEWSSTTDTFKVITAVPEPATVGMLGLGALAMMGIRRFTRRV